MLAFAPQSLGRNCNPAPDLVLREPVFLYVFFSGGVFSFADTGFYTILFYTILYYTMLYYTRPYCMTYTILNMLYCTINYIPYTICIILHYTTLHYTTLRYATLRYTTLQRNITYYDRRRRSTRTTWSMRDSLRDFCRLKQIPKSQRVTFPTRQAALQSRWRTKKEQACRTFLA